MWAAVVGATVFGLVGWLWALRCWQAVERVRLLLDEAYRDVARLNAELVEWMGRAVKAERLLKKAEAERRVEEDAAFELGVAVGEVEDAGGTV